MPSKLILSFLKVSVSVLFYFLAFVTVVFFLASIANLVGNANDTNKLTGNSYNYEVRSFTPATAESSINHSTDGVASFHAITDRFIVQIQPTSVMGYYALVMKLLFMGLGVAVLWNFKKIFSQTNLNDPFNDSVTRRLKVLSALFIVSDVLKLVDYFAFNSFLHQSINSPHFKLITDVGNGTITGLVIWLIAVIYERGIALKEENALTV
jgi:hypothetical protein